MNIDEFNEELIRLNSNEELTDFCRKFILHGTPFVFHGREPDFYDFRNRIGKEFDISVGEVYITGSAKLGFSPFKEKLFDLDSDIDIALVSPALFDRIMLDVLEFQYQLRSNRRCISEGDFRRYQKFLEYTAMGWIRPDKLPVSLQIGELKKRWFEFFDSISYGKSEVGNYKIAAGVFKSNKHLEYYILSGMRDLRNRLLIRSSK